MRAIGYKTLAPVSFSTLKYNDQDVSIYTVSKLLEQKKAGLKGAEHVGHQKEEKSKGTPAKTYAEGFFKPETCYFAESPKPKINNGSGDPGLADPVISSLMHSRYLARPSTSRVQSTQ